MDEDIEKWKIKKLLKSLQSLTGRGTSMVSLIIPPSGNLTVTNKMLTEEIGTASNIKSRVNRLSVLSAITSTQNRLKMYNKLPKNGLAIFCGTVSTEDNKERKVIYDFEPFKPINKSLYFCDSRFHCEPLEVLLEDSTKYGFIVLTGNEVVLAVLSGNSYNILYNFQVNLMGKTRRGGQSASRFSRLREEQIHNYLRRVKEQCEKYFITNNKLNVNSLILSGNGTLKNDFVKFNDLSEIIKDGIKKIIDVSYGGEKGLKNTIKLAGDFLSNVELIDEIKVLETYFDHISKDTGLFCYGIEDTIYCLEASAIEELIVWDDLSLLRYEFENKTTGENKIIYKKEDEDINSFVDTSVYELKSNEMLIEWLTNNYRNFGVKLSLVSNRSQEGNQFCIGFGGLGGILRWKLENPESM